MMRTGGKSASSWIAAVPCIALVGICRLVPAAEDIPRATVAFAVSAADGKPLPCRIHLLDSAAKPVKVEGYPYWRDHFVCDGTARVTVPPGQFRYAIERGPEYGAATGSFTLKAGETQAVVESLARIADLKPEGWWSGETHIHRPIEAVPLLMRAEDVHVGVVITWWNDRNEWKGRSPPAEPVVQFDGDRLYDVMGGEDERGGGALLFTGLREPLPIAGSKREHPLSSKWLIEAKAAGACADAEKPFWWDFPLWLSTDLLDSVGIANNHLHRGGVLDNEAWGRPRNRERLPGPSGNGLWTQQIYYHALNCGFRLPPSAGSASGVLPNPVGYNRVYAHVDGELTWDKWWESLRAGRVFVTNGPLLRLRASDQLPGHVFKSDGPLEIELAGKLDSRDPIAAIDLVRDGRAETIRLPARIQVNESGWFLVRATADVPSTYRFASTGPWYVEIAGRRKPPSRDSCAFFLDWIDERIEKLKAAPMTDEERREVLQVFEESRRFWEKRSSP